MEATRTIAEPNTEIDLECWTLFVIREYAASFIEEVYNALLQYRHDIPLCLGTIFASTMDCTRCNVRSSIASGTEDTFTFLQL